MYNTPTYNYITNIRFVKPIPGENNKIVKIIAIKR